MKELVYIASPAEIKAAGYKIIESQPMPEDDKPSEHPFKKFIS